MSWSDSSGWSGLTSPRQERLGRVTGVMGLVESAGGIGAAIGSLVNILTDLWDAVSLTIDLINLDDYIDAYRMVGINANESAWTDMMMHAGFNEGQQTLADAAMNESADYLDVTDDLLRLNFADYQSACFGAAEGVDECLTVSINKAAACVATAQAEALQAIAQGIAVDAVIDYAQQLHGVSMRRLMNVKMRRHRVESQSPEYKNYSQMWAQQRHEWVRKYGSMEGYNEFRDKTSFDPRYWNLDIFSSQAQPLMDRIGRQHNPSGSNRNVYDPNDYVQWWNTHGTGDYDF